MKFILGQKLGMTQVFKEDGTVVPVTRVQAGPCPVVQLSEKNGQTTVQIGLGVVKESKLAKPQAGHLKDLQKARFLRDFRLDKDDEQLKKIGRGDFIKVDSFVVGQKVEVIGTTKGKGFQGVVRRHSFHGSPASHGHKDQLRMPGSIGAGGPQRVFKGTRMAGRMGGGQVTVKNLEIMAIDNETNELLLKGAVPGAKGGLLEIRSKI